LIVEFKIKRSQTIEIPPETEPLPIPEPELLELEDDGTISIFENKR
jgi:hypothetical protein